MENNQHSLDLSLSCSRSLSRSLFLSLLQSLSSFRVSKEAVEGQFLSSPNHEVFSRKTVAPFQFADEHILIGALSQMYFAKSKTFTPPVTSGMTITNALKNDWSISLLDILEKLKCHLVLIGSCLPPGRTIPVNVTDKAN